MVFASSAPVDESVAVVTEMTKDLRLAAELGTSLLNANEDLRQQLRDALERERSLGELVADLRRKLANSDEEILTLSAELAELQQPKSISADEGRASRMEKSLQEVLSTIHADQQKLTIERKAIVDQAEAIRARENSRCRDIEAIRAHCFQLESRVDTMSMTNALVVLKSNVKLRRLEQELDDTKMKLLRAQTELKKMESKICKSGEHQDAKNRTGMKLRPAALHSEPFTRSSSEVDLEIDDERSGNDVLLDFFFLTAMACKINLVERGLSTAAFTITNEELFENLAKESNPVPFYQYHHWVRSRLANKLAPELDKDAKLSSWSYNSFWNFFWRK